MISGGRGDERNTGSRMENERRKRQRGRRKSGTRGVKEKAPGIVPIHDVNAESVLKNGENNGDTPTGSDSPFPRRFERRSAFSPCMRYRDWPTAQFPRELCAFVKMQILS